MVAEEVEYPFEMTDVLMDTMNVLAEQVRTHGSDALDRNQYEVEEAIRQTITAHVHNYEDRQKLFSRFKTSYRNACNILLGETTEGSSRGEQKTFSLAVADPEAIYTDHDGAMDAGKHFNGRVVKEVHSRSERFGRTTNERLYLIFRHAETRHEICNCPSMRYNFICKHSVANEIARNLPEEPDLYEE